MNFLEAVASLRDGKCGGIKRNHWNRREFALIEGCLMDVGDNCPAFDRMGVENFVADDWQLVNPIPQTETKEIKHYAVMNNGVAAYTCRTMECAEDWCKNCSHKDNLHIVELTGTYTVEVKPKVKRREEITLDREAHWRSVHMDSEIPGDTSTGHFFFEWEV